MTNFIEKLKQVAAGRTGLPWTTEETWSGDGYLTVPEIVGDNSMIAGNATFVAMAGNCFDELVAVAEAASFLNSQRWYTQEFQNIYTAIEKLRQKVEGEGG